MRGGVFSKNIWEGASERRNENIIVSGTLKISLLKRRFTMDTLFIFFYRFEYMCVLKIVKTSEKNQKPKTFFFTKFDQKCIFLYTIR
jgi:hypothetical protein